MEAIDTQHHQDMEEAVAVSKIIEDMGDKTLGNPQGKQAGPKSQEINAIEVKLQDGGLGFGLRAWASEAKVGGDKGGEEEEGEGYYTEGTVLGGGESVLKDDKTGDQATDEVAEDEGQLAVGDPSIGGSEGKSIS